ncbi:SPO11 [Candida jiufengensis]|uniref:SPO11 n=1 Tax=Candida jiufengensis TaxID=497108 RepID=UPI00222498E0|nr:SPO11 [Candida jiufengensis]KAI5952497.1 SPO11 [Candida jiufengensis]
MKLVVKSIQIYIPYELSHLTAIIKLIKIVINHLSQPNNLTTIRDIYYQDVEIFNKKQQECKKLLIDVFEDSLNWSLINDLNIHPTQKGLFFDSFSNEPMLIPINFENYFENKKFCINDLKIVVVEKDAVFHSFCQFLNLNSNSVKELNYIIITAKGFADKLTLRFLSFLNSTYKPIAIYGFFDSDVYGIMIYKQFNENCGNSNLNFNGIFLFDTNPISWLNITNRDFKIMSKMSNDINSSTHRELSRGMFFHKKVEMNVVSNKDGKDETTNYNQYIFNKTFK